jgi:hypothetical protein
VLHRLAGWPGVVAIVAVAAVVAGMCQTRVGHVMLRKVGLFEESANYTSLAFLHPQSLPKQLESKRANVRVSFVIRNAGGKPRDYQWSVLLVQGTHTRRVDGGIRVAARGAATITRSAEISCTRGRVRIVVSLARPAEFIDAWTVCQSARR